MPLWAATVYLLLGPGLSTVSATCGVPPYFRSRPWMKPSSDLESVESLDRPTVKPTIQPAFLTLVGFRRPLVLAWMAVVRVRMITHWDAETPVGHAGAMIGLLVDWPSSTIWAEAAPGAMRPRALRPAAIARVMRVMVP